MEKVIQQMTKARVYFYDGYLRRISDEGHVNVLI